MCGVEHGRTRASPVAIRGTASQGDRQKPTYVSGGVAGNLFVQAWGVGRVGDSRTPKNV